MLLHLQFHSAAENKKNISISVIIPARNEEKNLCELFDSLNNQTIKVREVILVDDNSTDNTPLIGKEYNAKVISLKSLPKGWVGKSWACYNGAKSTSIPVLLIVIAWIVGAIFPLNLFADCATPFVLNIFLIAIAFYISFIVQIYWMSYRIGNFNFLASVLYPILLAFFIIVFFYSLILTVVKKRVTWKDREIKI